jgi:AAA+ ATPase superfamily predicted ATPase
MFVGRKFELESLNKSYNRDAFQFPVIYGRRRVGKTTLINEFCRGRKTVYFVAVQSTAKENLEILSSQIYKVLMPEAPPNPFRSFREAIEYIFERAHTERIIFAVDEYPYLANSDKSVSSVLQAAIDRHQHESKLFLILCGSSMSFMETQVLGYESPLYGRRTAQYKLQPFDYRESAEMLPGFCHEEKIILYGITGGIPEYLFRIDNALTLRENLRNLFFDPSGRLFEEPANLLKQELKIPETYNAIIAAIASGRSKLNEIATKAGIETSQCSKMLVTLASLGIVRKEYPVTEVKSTKTLYILDDWMFVFWYRFVQPELSRITAGLGEVVCGEVFTGQLSSHTGRVFEECAKQYMWHALKNSLLPVAFKTIGRWWGSNITERREEEIDFIAVGADRFASDNREFAPSAHEAGNDAIFGECKWRNAPVGPDVLDDLIRKAVLLPRFKNVWYMLFSKSGFTDALKRRAAGGGNVQLVDVGDMFI